MAKQQNFFRGKGTADVVSDKDWVTIIDALLQDKSAESQQLAKKLLSKTKHGRLVRLLTMLQKKRPRINEMEKILKVSRRSIFRYLSGLEEYGITINMDEDYRYYIDRLPAAFKRLIAASKKA